MSDGEFREDLYHRLRVLSVEMPPLRQRGADVLELAHHFFGIFNSRFGIGLDGCTQEALDKIATHDWPGNVRELMHVVECAVLTTVGRSPIRVPHPDPGSGNPWSERDIREKGLASSSRCPPGCGPANATACRQAGENGSVRSNQRESTVCYIKGFFPLADSRILVYKEGRLKLAWNSRGFEECGKYRRRMTR